jgi:hypothetical protein
VFSSLPPAVGGLPEGTPERATNLPNFPRVHEMPPERSEGVLSRAERKKVESDLAAARDNAARRATEATAAATGANAATTEANAAPR